MTRIVVALTLLALPLALTGCLQRTLSITSTPPGALVWVNDVEVGATPLEMDFTYYGEFDVRVRRAGYEPILARKKLTPPLQERPVIDLFAEAIPAKFEDRPAWHFDLIPLASGAEEAAAEQAAIGRANELRGRVSPAPAEQPSPATR